MTRSEAATMRSAKGAARFEASGRTRYPSELIRRPHWYALRTRARHEKKTCRCLHAADVEAFAAVAEVERTWTDRTSRVGMVLFPGYIFVRIRLARLEEVVRWPGAVDLVRMRGVPSPVRDEEMAAVMQLARGVSRTGSLPTDVDYLEPGTPVRVESGPFEGMVGHLLSQRPGRRVAIRLDALRAARAVRIDRDCLVPLPAAPEGPEARRGARA